MLREYKVRGWFWWMTIAASGLSLVVGLDPATASESASPPETSSNAVRTVAASRGQAPLVEWRRAVQTQERTLSLPAFASGATAQALGARAVHGEPAVRGLRRLASSEVSAEMLVIARRIVREHHQARPGTEISFESGGQTYVARVERHYHPEGGAVKPWGYHPGVSLLKAR